MPPTDDEIVAALRSLSERFDSEYKGSIDTIHEWVSDNDADTEVIDVLERDAVIAEQLATPGQLVLMNAQGGVGYSLRNCVVAFLRQVRIGDLPFEDEAERFLRSVRLEGGVVPALVRTVVFGFSVCEPVDLPFGKLVPAERKDIALPKLKGDPPPAVVLEAIVDIPALIVDPSNDPRSNEDRDRDAAAMYEAINEPIDRLLVALAVSYANPIQDHLAWVGALYPGALMGLNPLPIGAALTDPPPGGYPELDIDRLKRNADAVGQVPDVKPIAIAARRYFMAISERARPADKLIDLVIAIEALTDESKLERQRTRLVQLLTGGALSDEKIHDDFTLIKYARNTMVHTGKIEPNAANLASLACMYVDLAIHASVREAFQRSRPAAQAGS
jgi:hypothetical protein